MSGFSSGTGLANNLTVFESGYIDDLNVSNTLYYQGVLLDPLLNTKVANLRTEINDLSGVVFDLSGYTYTAINDVSNNVNDLSGVVLDLSTNFNSINTQFTDLSGVVYDLSGAVFDLSGRFLEIEDDYNFLASSLSQVIFDVSDLSGVVSDLSAIVYDLSENGAGSSVFEIDGTTARLKSTFTEIDASSATIQYDVLTHKHNQIPSNGSFEIGSLTASQAYLYQSQPNLTSIGGRLNFQTDTPSTQQQTQFVINGTYDENMMLSPLRMKTASGADISGNYSTGMIFFGGDASTDPFPSTTRALYYNESQGQLEFEGNKILLQGTDVLDPFVEGTNNNVALKSVYTGIDLSASSGGTLINTKGDLNIYNSNSNGLTLTTGGITADLPTSIEYNTASNPMLLLRKSNQNSASTIRIENDFNNNRIEIGSQQKTAYYGTDYKNCIDVSGDLIITNTDTNSYYNFHNALTLYGTSNCIHFGTTFAGTPTTSSLYLNTYGNLAWGNYTVIDSNNWQTYIPVGDASYFYQIAPPSSVLNISGGIENLNWNNLNQCKFYNSGGNLLFSGGGTNTVEMLLDGTNGAEVHNINSSEILRLQDDGNNYSATATFYNTKSSNSETSIGLYKGSYFGKVGVNNAGRTFMYSDTTETQLYVNGGTSLTLKKASGQNELRFDSDSWNPGDQHLFGLSVYGNGILNSTRYLNFSYDNGIQYVVNSKHEFQIGYPAIGLTTFMNINGSFVNEVAVLNGKSFLVYENNNWCRIDNGYVEILRGGGNQWSFGPGVGNGAYNDLNFYNTSSQNNFEMKSNGDFVIAGSYNPSDARIKKNIQEIKDDASLTIVKQIEPTTYNYVDEKRGTEKVYGFIAQQVKSVFPPAIRVDKGTLPNIMKPVFINGDVITFANATPIQVGTRLKFRDWEDEVEFFEPDAQTGKPVRKILKIDYGNIKVLKQFATNKYQLNQTLNYKKAVCIGEEIDDFNYLSKEKLLPILWSGVQELIREKEALETKVNSLESRLAKLEQTFVA